MAQNKNKNNEEVIKVVYPRVDSKEDREKNFVMCPTSGCTQKLMGTWKDFEIGKSETGLTIYRCPACNSEFTINDFKTNAIPIPDQDGLAVVFNKQTYQILLKIPGYTRFIDSDGTAYINVPIHSINKEFTSLLYLTDIDVEEFNDEEIKRAILEYLKEKEEKR